MRKYAALEVLEAWRQAVPGDPGSAERRIMKTAHRVAFEYEPRPGFLYVRSRMISSRTNDNHDTFPADEIEKGYQSFLGKPVFVNHHNANHRRARGVIVAVALHRDHNADRTPDTWVEGLMEIDAVRFPRLTKAIMAGRVNRTSMGVDVDWSTCSACGNKATSPAEYCNHLPAMKGKKIRQRNRVTGKVEEKLIHEVCAGLSFFENSLLVEDPADPTAYLLGKPDARGLGKTAGAVAGDPDFRDHFTNTCMECGDPVAFHPASRNGKYGDRWKHDSGAAMKRYDHEPDPVDRGLMNKKMYPTTFGGTRCLACGDDVKVNLHALDRNGGWHHHDGMKRDHDAIPLDAQKVYDSVPGVRAKHEQAHQDMKDHMHGLFEQMSGHELPRKPRGDEHLMPPDPFTAALSRTAAAELEAKRKKKGGDWKPVRGYGGEPRFDGVSLKRDNRGFFVHTHRARSDSYGHPDEIPAADIDFIRSTGAVLGDDEDGFQRGDHQVQHNTFVDGGGGGGPQGVQVGTGGTQHETGEAKPSRKKKGGDHPFFQANPIHKDNVVKAYHATTDDEKALGDRWYSDAHHVAKAIAGGDAALGAGLLSAYSPQTAWPVNMFNASRAAKGDPPGPGSGAMGSQQKPAMRILAGEHHSDVLKAPKTSAFAHLIEHGGDSEDDRAQGKSRVVIDRHALSVAAGRRLGKEEGSKAPLGQTQHYEHVEKAYRDAAGELSEHYGRTIEPHQVQAATWLGQIRNNQAEDSSGTRGGAGVGRVNMQNNSKTRWVEHHVHHHPSGIDPENMHYHGRRALAYGETRVPPQVDTLRMDECPVCGEHNVWSGSRCPVCGFVVPPSVFRDPDTSKAQDVRDQLDQTGDVSLPGDGAGGDGQVPAGQGQMGSGQDADDQLTHPDQIAPDGVPTVQGGDGGPQGTDGQPPAMAQPPEGAGAPAPEEQGEPPMQAEGLECPACGTTFETDGAAQPGVPCPACGMAALHPAGEEGDPAAAEGEEEPGDPRKEQEDPSVPGEESGDEEDDEDEDKDMPASKTAAALAQAQARRIAELSAQNEVLSAQLRYVASAAGIERELAEVSRLVLRRQADILNPGSPVPDPPEAPATETTEQALNPEAMDDAGRPGTTPGANSRVPAQQTTTAITPGVEIQTPPATNLVDVTAPVQGTNPSQDGGVPLSQRRIETDVRVNPDPLAAHGPGIGGQGDNGSAFPWILDAQPGGQAGPGGNVTASAGHEADASRRTFAAIRLAGLRVQAGLAQGEPLSVGERIERDAALSTVMIEHEISTLERIGSAQSRQAPRPAQRTAARSAPSLASVGAASHYAPAVMDDLDASDLFD